MRLLLCGGGTEGHIAPSLALAEEMNKTADSFLFVGRKHGEENKKILKAKYPYLPIDIRSPASFKWYEKYRYISTLIYAVQESLAIIKDFAPDAVFATGGYVSLPPVIAAHRLGIPIFLHESNAIAGMATKAMMKYAKALFLGMPGCEGNFKGAKQIFYTGTPTRAAFFKVSRASARHKLGLNDEFMILSFGGSLGAKALNESCIELLKSYSKKRGVVHIHITGKRYFDELNKIHHFSSFSYTKCKAVSFVDNMEYYLKASDIVICRSGAATISEILASGAYPIFIPSPNVKGNHQLYNAKAIARLCGVPIIEEKPGLGERIEKQIEAIRENPSERRKKGDFLRSLTTPSCASDILSLIKKHSESM